jgi:hypothetical protein
VALGGPHRRFRRRVIQLFAAGLAPAPGASPPTPLGCQNRTLYCVSFLDVPHASACGDGDPIRAGIVGQGNKWKTH